MPSDDIGIIPRDMTVRGVPPGPGGPGGASTSRAVVRLPAVAPASGTPSGTVGSGPLGRSGIDLLDVLDAPDVHVARESVAPVALEVGLERARGALLRGLPVDALVSLDTVWEGARRTEDGWYLRGGALVALGLPGEGDRLAEEGLGVRASSAALRFLQSLARLAMRDVAGARATLAVALQLRPGHPLLVAQDAIVQAQQGDRGGAESALHTLMMHAMPDDPVVAYARDAVRTALANHMRGGSSASPTAGGTAAPGNGVPLHDLAAVLQAVDDGISATRDPLSSAMHRLGARILLLRAADVAIEARALLGALSSGGALAGSCRAETAHAARGLLVALLGAVHDGDARRPPAPSLLKDIGSGIASERAPDDASEMQRLAASGVVGDIVRGLRAGRVDEAVRLVRRHHGSARESSGALLLALVRGALSGVQCAHESGRGAGAAAHDGTINSHLPVVQDETRGPVVPLRLGLRLLAESAAERLAGRVAGDPAYVTDAESPRAAPLHRGDRSDAGAIAGSFGTARSALEDVADPLQPGHASDAAPGGHALHYAAAAARGEHRREGSGASTASAMAVSCVILAAFAAAFDFPVLAVALGVGASWLAVRRMTARTDDPASGDAGLPRRSDPESAPDRPADDIGHRR